MRAAPRRDEALREQGDVGTSNSTIEAEHIPARRFLKALHASILHAGGLLSYSLEDARQRHAMRRQGGAR